jgi:hypothetical protein
LIKPVKAKALAPPPLPPPEESWSEDDGYPIEVAGSEEWQEEGEEEWDQEGDQEARFQWPVDDDWRDDYGMFPKGRHPWRE